MSIFYPRACGKSIWRVILNEYESEMKELCLWMLKKQLERPLEYLEVEL